MKVLRFKLFVTIALSAYLFIGPGCYAAGEEEKPLIPVRFLQNNEISLDLYPMGFQAAAVFAGTGINGENKLYPLKRLVMLLANQGVRGTVFISTGETFRNNLAGNQAGRELLSKLASSGFEIAQNSPPYISRKPGSEQKNKDGSGARSLLSSRWLDGIKENREFLASLGQEPVGYRGSDSTGSGRIMPRLDKMGYLYFCADYVGDASGEEARMNPSTDSKDIYIYPESTAGLQILRFETRLDPIVDPRKVRQIFEEVSRKSGVSIYHIDLPGLIEDHKLDKLRQFIIYLKERNVWICSLEELSRWWIARKKVKIETGWDGDTLVIIYDNPTRFLLKNARLNFNKPKLPTRNYRVENRRGIITSQGTIPANRIMNVTLFSTAPSEKSKKTPACPGL